MELRDDALGVALPIQRAAEETFDEREKLILMAVFELRALDSDAGRRTEEIADRAFGSIVTYENLKPVIRDLKGRK